MELDADVSLSVSFGYCYVQFNLPVASLSEPVAKHPSALDVLLVNTARCDELPGKRKRFLPENFVLTDQPKFF